MRKERRGAPGGRQNEESYLHKLVTTPCLEYRQTWLSQHRALQFCPKAAVCDDGAHPDFPAFPTKRFNYDALMFDGSLDA